MTMANERICDACGMAYDWAPVNASGFDYCCESCSRGEACTCPQHNHAAGPWATPSATEETVGGAGIP
jgi:hypothetical protein